MSQAIQLRDLPSVHELLSQLGPIADPFPRAVVAAEVRRVLETARDEIRRGIAETEPLKIRIQRALHSLSNRSLRRVINATGVVLHTNLGRAPVIAHDALTGFSNLEYDLSAGKRGKRDSHTDPLFERLLGKPAIAVNNGAAALYLVLHELASAEEVIVSRGELIEIGDGFRIPEIMRHSGALLREVGTTNRTRIGDYRDAITDRTRVLLRVHPSNFRITGFTARPELSELIALGRERGVLVVEDLGSGCVVDLRPFGINEPQVQDSIAAGVNLVSFSGDKLLGGPQAGIVAGDADLVRRLRRNPMFRALRLDKLIYQALEATLRALLFEQWEALPALRMVRLNADEIRVRAEKLATRIPGATVEASESLTGGGSTPDQHLPTFVIVLPGDAVSLEKRLRTGSPPIIGRIENDRVVLDLRTVFTEEEPELLARISEA